MQDMQPSGQSPPRCLPGLWLGQELMHADINGLPEMLSLFVSQSLHFPARRAAGPRPVFGNHSPNNPPEAKLAANRKTHDVRELWRQKNAARATQPRTCGQGSTNQR